MDRLILSLIIVIVLLIIYLCYVSYNTYIINDYLNGYWYADPIFCQQAEAENIVFLFNKGVATIAVSQGDEYIENTVTRFSTSFSYIPIGEYYDCSIYFQKKPRLFPKVMNMRISIKRGNVAMYRNKKIYANLYKNHVISETIKVNKNIKSK